MTMQNVLPNLLPSLFLSHGAPTLPLAETPARAFSSGSGGMIARPKAIKAILVISLAAPRQPMKRRPVNPGAL